MSMSLDGIGTNQPGLEVRMHGFGSMRNTVDVGKYEISLEDFLLVVMYVLTNTDLEANDQRRQFVKSVQSMKEVDGYNPNTKRLASDIPATVPA